jgi:hypothetical protein
MPPADSQGVPVCPDEDSPGAHWELPEPAGQLAATSLERPHWF